MFVWQCTLGICSTCVPLINSFFPTYFSAGTLSFLLLSLPCIRLALFVRANLFLGRDTIKIDFGQNPISFINLLLLCFDAVLNTGWKHFRFANKCCIIYMYCVLSNAHVYEDGVNESQDRSFCVNQLQIYC